MANNRDTNIIKFIDRNCDEILAGVARCENPFEAVLNSHFFRDGMAMKLFKIADLAQSLTDDFTKEHGNLPWREAKDFKAVCEHSYLTLDVKKMWATVTDVIPELKQFCRDILALAERQARVPPMAGPGTG
ncbi:MAG: DUF86 domain-containing protein [Deltaproteobacteria bacterium]|jgi:uncharacterized protein with HEPN domain|nr:DUF86 domain-containing protein [Deltaproteobacteria bacterium]